jgi:hypothetical protein
MRDQVFTEPWLDTRPRPGNAEPELGLRSAPRLPDSLSHGKGKDRIDPPSPPDPVPCRSAVTSAPLPVSSLFYVVLLGLVATATIGVFFGAGFSLLTHHGNETIADAGTRDRSPPRSYSNATQTEREDPAGQQNRRQQIRLQ